MDIRGNCQRHIWILSGTGDGPPLVKALLTKGWAISVSVVSIEASLSYAHLPIEALWVGALEGEEGIRKVLINAREQHEGFDWIVDATHPFAKVISSNLQSVCEDLGQPLLRFDRCCKTIPEAILINDFSDLLNFDLIDQKILFAIGSKYLRKALDYAHIAGAVPFARVLPTVESIIQGFAADLFEDHLAVVKPVRGQYLGEIEEALCRKWEITGIVARESGGLTQQMWQKIAQTQGLDLWLIARPETLKNVPVFYSYLELLDHI